MRREADLAFIVGFEGRRVVGKVGVPLARRDEEEVGWARLRKLYGILGVRLVVWMCCWWLAVMLSGLCEGVCRYGYCVGGWW